MRPRISQLEAQFLLETIQIRKEEIQGLIERKEQLDREVYQLKKEAFYNPMIFINQDFKDKKQELRDLEAQSYRMFLLIGCFDSLSHKLSMLASGEKHRGRYPFRATLHEWQLTNPSLRMEPKSP